MQKESFMAYFKALSQNLPGKIMENHVKSQTEYPVCNSGIDLETLNMMQDTNSLTVTFSIIIVS
jgi:hypothetical protein